MEEGDFSVKDLREGLPIYFMMSVGSVTMIIGAHSAVLSSEIFLRILQQSQEAFGGEGMVVSSG